MSALRSGQALIKSPHQQEELNEEKSLSARDGTRDERWMGVGSGHSVPDDNDSEDLPGPAAVSVKCSEHDAESNVGTAAEFGSATFQ